MRQNIALMNVQRRAQQTTGKTRRVFAQPPVMVITHGQNAGSLFRTKDLPSGLVENKYNRVRSHDTSKPRSKK